MRWALGNISRSSFDVRTKNSFKLDPKINPEIHCICKLVQYYCPLQCWLALHHDVLKIGTCTCRIWPHCMTAAVKISERLKLEITERKQTLVNCFKRLLGLCEVVTTTLGSSTPAHRYSSSWCVVLPVQESDQMIKVLVLVHGCTQVLCTHVTSQSTTVLLVATVYSSSPIHMMWFGHMIYKLQHVHYKIAVVRSYVAHDVSYTTVYFIWHD